MPITKWRTIIGISLNKFSVKLIISSTIEKILPSIWWILLKESEKKYREIERKSDLTERQKNKKVGTFVNILQEISTIFPTYYLNTLNCCSDCVADIQLLNLNREAVLRIRFQSLSGSGIRRFFSGDSRSVTFQRIRFRHQLNF